MTRSRAICENRAVPFLWISLGAVLGANARFLVGLWVLHRLGAAFPYGTLVVNATGSLLVGLVLGVMAERADVDPAWRLTLVAGFCGSYTTFSTFSFEAIALLREGAFATALVYVLTSVALSLLATGLGLIAARAI
jgi:CrcB protein